MDNVLTIGTSISQVCLQGSRQLLQGFHSSQVVHFQMYGIILPSSIDYEPAKYMKKYIQNMNTAIPIKRNTCESIKNFKKKYLHSNLPFVTKH